MLDPINYPTYAVTNVVMQFESLGHSAPDPTKAVNNVILDFL